MCGEFTIISISLTIFDSVTLTGYDSPLALPFCYVYFTFSTRFASLFHSISNDCRFSILRHCPRIPPITVSDSKPLYATRQRLRLRSVAIAITRFRFLIRSSIDLFTYLLRVISTVVAILTAPIASRCTASTRRLPLQRFDVSLQRSAFLLQATSNHARA